VKLFLLIIPIAVLAVGHLAAQVGPLLEPRDWTSDDGNTIRASLLSYDGSEAELRLENGARVKIPESRFSTQDQAELVRAYINANSWSKLPPPQSTRYYYSPKTSEHDTHEKIVAQMSFGPGRFSYGLKVHSTKINLNEYNRLTFDDGSGKTFHLNYKPAEVATWGDKDRPTTRVVAAIQAENNLQLVPILKKGLNSGKLTIYASNQGGPPRYIDLSRDEIEALDDLFRLFVKALPLVQTGVIKEELLEKQNFSSGSAPTPGRMSDTDDSSLQRFKSSQGGGRFGEITWTPANGQATPVRGLGWIDQFVVIRTADDEVKKVAFTEIDDVNQKKILEARLDDLAGARPPTDNHWTSYYAKELEGNQTTYSQGFVFKRAAQSGSPHLFVQTYATKFEGKPISRFVISGDTQPDSFTVLNDSTKTVTGDKTSWSVASQQITGAALSKIGGLAGSKSIKIVVYSGDDFTTIILRNERLTPSSEAISCYLWADEMAK